MSFYSAHLRECMANQICSRLMQVHICTRAKNA